MKENSYLFQKILPTIFLALLALLPALTVVLAPYAPLQIINTTPNALNIDMAFAGTDGIQPAYTRSFQGVAAAGESFNPGVRDIKNEIYLIEAKDDQNNYLYSREFTREELAGLGWQVTITGSEDEKIKKFAP